MNTTANLDGWIAKDGVRHDATHSLRADRSLTPGEAVRREWRCICGHDFGLLYDNAATGAYRLHRKESASPAPRPYVAANGNRFTAEQAKLITEPLRYEP